MKKLICFIFIMTVFISCDSREKKSNKDKVTVVNHTTVTTINSKNEQLFSFISKPFKTSELSFRVGGPINNFEVFSGNSYKKGELIAQIDSRDFILKKERAEAIFNLSKSEYERIKKLYDSNNIAASVYDKALADYSTARSNYETAQNELSDTRLVAPFSGYIGDVYIEKFQDVKATQPIVSLIDIERLKIEAYIPQSVAYLAKDKKNVSIKFDALEDKVFDAKIVVISKNTTKNNLSYLLTAEFNNQKDRLSAGMSGNVLFNFKESAIQKSNALPLSAICNKKGSGCYVWVINPKTLTVTKRDVVIGSIHEKGLVNIVSGVTEGEMVATSSLRFLSNNDKVELKNIVGQ